jgi:predicted transposase/invertase (TIGR01784 family)
LDCTFKAIFTSNTEESNIAICEFLTDAIGREVKEITILQNEPAMESKQEKQIRYDISCKLDDGEQANVEIQVNAGVNFPKRLEYYASKLLVMQEIKGHDYGELNKSYQISMVVKGSVFNDEHAVHSFEQYDRENDISLGGNVRIITVEASKLKWQEGKGLEVLEKWAMWFKYASDPKKRELINELIEEKEGLRMATKTLVKISRDEDMRMKAFEEDKIVTDYWNDILASKREGKQEGIEQGKIEGIEQGKIEGIKERNIKIAKNLLKMGMDVAVISQVIGLSKEEIEALK